MPECQHRRQVGRGGSWICRDCGEEVVEESRFDFSRRKFPAVRGDIAPHFNDSLGTFVGSRRQMAEEAAKRGMVERPWRCDRDTPTEERAEMIREDMVAARKRHVAAHAPRPGSLAEAAAEAGCFAEVAQISRDAANPEVAAREDSRTTWEKVPTDEEA